MDFHSGSAYQGVMPSVKFTLNASLGQSSEKSCWFAAYRMLFDYKNKPNNIRARMEAAGLDYADCWNNGLPDTLYSKTRLALGLSGFRRSYFSSLASDLDYFGKTLTDYGPFWCAFSSPQDGDHAVVVNGVDLNLKQVLVMNPWGSGGSTEQEYYTATKFQSRLSKRTDQISAAQMFL